MEGAPDLSPPRQEHPVMRRLLLIASLVGPLSALTAFTPPSVAATPKHKAVAAKCAKSSKKGHKAAKCPTKKPKSTKATNQAQTTTVATATLLGSSSVASSPDSDSAGQAEAFPFTAAATGSTTTASIYLDTGNRAKSVKLGVYSNVDG